MTLPNLEAKLKAGSYALALVSYAMDVCPDPGFILMKGNTGNYVRYKSEKMDNLCKSLRTQVTQEGFRQKLMEIQTLFYEDCPFLCLYWRTGTVVSRYMYTTNRDVREYQLLRGIQGFFTK
jgi:ABC-type transport system substrate-binding protein